VGNEERDIDSLKQKASYTNNAHLKRLEGSVIFSKLNQKTFFFNNKKQKPFLKAEYEG